MEQGILRISCEYIYITVSIYVNYKLRNKSAVNLEFVNANCFFASERLFDYFTEYCLFILYIHALGRLVLILPKTIEWTSKFTVYLHIRRNLIPRTLFLMNHSDHPNRAWLMRRKTVICSATKKVSCSGRRRFRTLFCFPLYCH